MHNTQIYLDGANLDDVEKLANENNISGFTSNPSLMFNSGIKNYDEFIIKFLSLSNNKPVSFEVVSDEFEQMYKEAKKISSYSESIYIKIPIINTQKQSSVDLIRSLLDEGHKINVTAILSQNQLDSLTSSLLSNDDVIISYFAGRVADTGIDPVPVINKLQNKIKDNKLLNAKILWASPREVYNIYQAKENNVDIITVTKSLIDKLELYKKDLDDYSLETVKMFLNDAKKNNLKI
tara:strand:- start:5559 stop:6266 length:708 start_codon:yes stop_codon:yes gene_type:complete